MVSVPWFHCSMKCLKLKSLRKIYEETFCYKYIYIYIYIYICICFYFLFLTVKSYKCHAIEQKSVNSWDELITAFPLISVPGAYLITKLQNAGLKRGRRLIQSERNYLYGISKLCNFLFANNMKSLPLWYT